MLWYVRSLFQWMNKPPGPVLFSVEELPPAEPYEVLTLPVGDVIRIDGEVPAGLHSYLRLVGPHRSPTHALCRHGHMRRL